MKRAGGYLLGLRSTYSICVFVVRGAGVFVFAIRRMCPNDNNNTKNGTTFVIVSDRVRKRIQRTRVQTDRTRTQGEYLIARYRRSSSTCSANCYTAYVRRRSSNDTRTYHNFYVFDVLTTRVRAKRKAIRSARTTRFHYHADTSVPVTEGKFAVSRTPGRAYAREVATRVVIII